MTVGAGIVADRVVETATRILDDRIYEHTVIKRTKRGEVRHTIQINGWHVLGGMAVASAVIWSGMSLGLLRWKPYQFKVVENGKEVVKVINLPSADVRGNEKAGVKPMPVSPAEWITGSWLSPLWLLKP